MEQFPRKETGESGLLSFIVNNLERGDIAELTRVEAQKIIENSTAIPETAIAKGATSLLTDGSYGMLILLMSFPVLGRRAEALLVRAPEQFEESIIQGIRANAEVGDFKELGVLFSLPGIGQYALSILKENSLDYDTVIQEGMILNLQWSKNRLVSNLRKLAMLYGLPIFGERAELIAQNANQITDTILEDNIHPDALGILLNLPGIGERIKKIFDAESGDFQKKIINSISLQVTSGQFEGIVSLSKTQATKEWISMIVEKYLPDASIQEGLIQSVSDGKFDIISDVCALPEIGIRAQKIVQDENCITGDLLRKGITSCVEFTNFNFLASLCANQFLARTIEALADNEPLINPLALENRFYEERIIGSHIHPYLSKIFKHPVLGWQMLSGLEYVGERGGIGRDRVKIMFDDALDDGNIIFVNTLSQCERFKAYSYDELAGKKLEELRRIAGLFIKQELPPALITSEVLQEKIEELGFFNDNIAHAQGAGFLSDADFSTLQKDHEDLIHSTVWESIQNAQGAMDALKVSSAIEIEPSIALTAHEMYEQQYNPSTETNYLTNLVTLSIAQNKILHKHKLTNQNMYDSVHLDFGVHKEEQIKLQRYDNEIRAFMNLIQLMFNPVNRTHYLLSTPEHRKLLVTCGDVKSGIQGEYDAVFQLRGLCLMHGATSFDIRFLSSLERYVKKLIKTDDISYLAEDTKALLNVVKPALKAAEEMIKEEDPNYAGILLGEGDEACDGDMWLHLLAMRGEFKEREAGKSASGIFAMGKNVNDRNSILGIIKSVLDSRTNT